MDVIIALSGTTAVVLGAVIALLLSNERRLTKLETTSTFVQGRLADFEKRLSNGS